MAKRNKKITRSKGIMTGDVIQKRKIGKFHFNTALLTQPVGENFYLTSSNTMFPISNLRAPFSLYFALKRAFAVLMYWERA